ncbi:MAG: FtsX-like permease family protein [Bacteroidetes bacterium]|nr:FtsX-like permease family protein [Bacteroidota bacterium]
MKSSDDKGNTQTIIGVVKDFHSKSLHNKIEPLILPYADRQSPVITVSAKPGSSQKISDIYHHFIDDVPFRQQYITDMLVKQYEPDRKASVVFDVFTALAIFLSCLGLFGLTTLVLRQRTREIGIRKLLGAGKWQLARVLSSSFLLLVLLALVIAIPIAGIVMQKWLQTYPYHTRIDWIAYSTPILSILLVTVMVISIEINRASKTDIVKSIS